jgi:hypothetical protein
MNDSIGTAHLAELTRRSRFAPVLFWGTFVVGIVAALLISDYLALVRFGHRPDAVWGVLSLIGLCAHVVLAFAVYLIWSMKRGRT